MFRHTLSVRQPTQTTDEAGVLNDAALGSATTRIGNLQPSPRAEEILGYGIEVASPAILYVPTVDAGQYPIGTQVTHSGVTYTVVARGPARSMPPLQHAKMLLDRI
jgi:hypothetical protein